MKPASYLFRPYLRMLLPTVMTVASSGFVASAQSGLRIEVSVNGDKGIGNGLSFAAEEGDNDFSVSLSDLTPGVHIISFRACDDSGRWTPTITRTLYICEGATPCEAEYFIDVDPGEGNGVSVSAGFDGMMFSVPTQSLSSGVHTLSLRSKNSEGTWTGLISKTFLVTSNGMALEWFIDNDPGVGNANILEASDDGDNIFMVPTADLSPGAHIISMRARDSRMTWTSTRTLPLYVLDSYNLTEMEYYVDDDPGEGNAIEVSGNGTDYSFTVPTDNLSEGTHQMNLRGLTDGGQWLTVFSAPFEITSRSGIETVEWQMQFRAWREGRDLCVSGLDIADSVEVAVYNLAGVRLAVHSLPGGFGADEVVRFADLPATTVIVAVSSHGGSRSSKLVN